MAFLFSELADFAVYQPLRERRWLAAVFASNLVGLVIDSALFLQIALEAWTSSKGRSSARSGRPSSRSWCCWALRRWVIPRYSRPADEPTVPQIA